MLASKVRFSMILLFVLTPLVMWSQGLSAASAGPAWCTMAGTWYGGSADAKYMLTIIQNPDGSYTMIGQGAFTQANLGYPVTTAFSNSIVKVRGNKAEFFGTGMVNKSAIFPAPEPELWALHGTATLNNCSTLTLNYDFFGSYVMPTNKVPFVDAPDYVVVPPPFSESYRKMPTTCRQCTP